MQSAILDEIHQFWFGPLPDFASFNEDRFPLWFGGTRDGEIIARFAATLEAADGTPIDPAGLTPPRQVALVVLFDQFPRSIYRGDHRCFAFDEWARAAVAAATVNGLAPFKLVERSFFTICLGHSEHLADQERASQLFEADIIPFAPAGNRFYEGGRIQTVKYLDIIRRFGRFPHRNVILGRETTAEESRFLAETKMTPF